MNSFLIKTGYILDVVTGIWSRQDYTGIAYSDGDEVEQRIASIINEASDLGVLSSELRQHCTDWPSLYHLSGTRANILRPFENNLHGDILEIGAGCGAITRYLGECGGNVLALEGSPRRAAIARARTRDLQNVTVVSDRFDLFSADQKFDAITLIGVLEYANLFTPGESPALNMLERVRALLKPEGKLFIAIENQLGLKYFAGAPEDHLGQPMYGIEGRYRNDQPQTFGRIILAEMLKEAGFSACDFLAPFPDYKLPVSVITERGFKTEKFDAAAFAWQSVRRDPQLPSILAFSPELVWPTLAQNGLALDLANSFLIVASSNKESNLESSTLAWHFTTERKKEFCKKAVFLQTEEGKIKVIYQSLTQRNNKVSSNTLLKFDLPNEAEYIFGTPLSQELITIVTRDGWRIEELCILLRKYLDIVANVACAKWQIEELSEPTIKLPGSTFDCIPQNIITSTDGRVHIIDKEWEATESVQIGFLCFRSLITLFHNVTKFGHSADEFGKTYINLIQAVMNGLGWLPDKGMIISYVNLEAAIQTEVSGRVVTPKETMDWLDGPISKLNNLNQAVIERDGQIANLNQAVTERDDQITSLGQAVAERDRQITSLSQTVIEYEQQIAFLINSRSWRVTKPLRVAGRLTRGEFSVVMASLEQGRFRRVATTIRQARNAMRYVLRGDFSGLRDRLRARRRDAAFVNITSVFDAPGEKTWGIMTPPHTIYLARLIAEQLKRHGWGVHIMTEAPTSFRCDWYIVLCPQIFSRLPPGERRIVYQLEQSVSSRWFTAEYFKTLNESLAVLDYSLKNIGFLEGKGIGYPHVFYLPIGASNSYGQIVGRQEKTCDVLFYGDSNSSPRRRQMLAALRQHFNVRVANELFGQDMLVAIKQARVVINLHYYEHALLEMPRIQECLSLGVPVVSESAQDQGDYPELHSAVRFFEEGSIPAMLSAVRLALDRPVSAEEVREAASLGARRFDFMFDRLLVGMGFLPSLHVRHMQLPIPTSADRIALSLPETISRRKVFEAAKPNACFVFDGMRRRPGWIGCGLSYLALAQYALAAGKSSLTVMEDDVILPPDFEEKLTVIREYLDTCSGQWDVFAGVIASLHPDYSILSVEVFKDLTFVTIDKMTSTVFNIYSDGFLRLLKSWNPENLDAASNTIDRFIESSANLRVVVMLPYFVEHREEVHSTLWGFQNTQYRDMIAESQATLYRKALALQESQRCLAAD